MRPLTVVKVGGSLYDLPDLRSRLDPWLSQAKTTDIILVPGGGATVDVIRDLDRVHRLGEERAHWLALDAMRLNAAFLVQLLSRVDLIPHWDRIDMARSQGAQAFVINAVAFDVWDRMNSANAALPRRWSVTSDSIAARVAVASGANQLILLKSITIPPNMNWEEASERGFVDEWFAQTVRPSLPQMKVNAINLRDWRP